MEQLTQMLVTGAIRSVVILRDGDSIRVNAEPSPNRWVRVKGSDMADCLERLGRKLADREPEAPAVPMMPGF